MSDRSWLPEAARKRESEIAAQAANLTSSQIEDQLRALIDRNREIHNVECVNLNPATNVMNPRAEAMLSQGLGSRPSLGYAGLKYEMGLEAIEEIEVIAARLACQVFGARYAEIRVGSGALANLYAFMATCKPGDSIIVPPATVGGHITHRDAGAAGLYGLRIFEAPINAAQYSIDVDGLAELANRVKPKLITLGASLNLVPHPVKEVRKIADGVGAKVLFDAAHACGLFAGKAWPNPLDEGAHLMTMSTYKSLGGPAGGLLLTNDAHLAERVDAIAYPGLTANFDVAKSASLAITLLDWIEHGGPYINTMISTAKALAVSLNKRGIHVFGENLGFTTSHQFAINATNWTDGHQASLRLREANILACAIGLPGLDEWSGTRFGVPEIVRWGMNESHMPELADLIAEALTNDPAMVAERTSKFRKQFTQLHFVR
jgi:glycine hydroxymethyltransferase